MDLTAADFLNPPILLAGAVDYNMYQSFRSQFLSAPQEGTIVIELTTLGGDPEVARMMGEDVRFHSELQPNRRLVFLGKAAIYSAGTTFMSFFAPENRYLTRGARLLVHERQLSKTIDLAGPLTLCLTELKATINEIQTSIAIQEEGFANLISGSSVTLDQVREGAVTNWYVEAEEARALGLIHAII